MATRQPSRALTISLGGLDFLEQRLEPTERRRVAADPEELHTLEGAERALLLAVPDVLEDGRERSHTCVNCQHSRVLFGATQTYQYQHRRERRLRS